MNGQDCGCSYHYSNDNNNNEEAVCPSNQDTEEHLTAICGERVSQMTRTFNDIEAVTRLLEEKERDLELAARIGQALLEKNRDLETRNEALDVQLQEATEKLKQLQYEISVKDDLLHIYVKDYEGSDDSQSDSIEGVKSIVNLETLQRKVRNLEEENDTLRIETSDLRTTAVDLEAKEEQLVTELCQQLGENQAKLKQLTDDISNKSDVNIRQQEEITELMTKLIIYEEKVKKITLENADLQTLLSASQTSQKSLTKELSELKEKLEECQALIREQTEELKALRRHHGPRALRHHFSTFTPMLPTDSLASELESSLRQDHDFPDGYSPEQRKSHTSRVLETAKFVRKASSQPVSRTSSFSQIPGSIPSSAWNSSSGNASCESICGSSTRESLDLSEAEGSDGCHGDTTSISSPVITSTAVLGRPGIPGSNDLQIALQRLNNRQNPTDGALHQPDEASQPHKHSLNETTSECRTPESIMSTGSDSHVSDFTRLSAQYRLPQKLQIVKPIEGSLVLHQWQRLATPHMAGIFEDRPGVSVKGERHLDLDGEMYMLSDIEEDGTLHWASSRPPGLAGIPENPLGDTMHGDHCIPPSLSQLKDSNLPDSNNPVKSTNNNVRQRVLIGLQGEGALHFNAQFVAQSHDRQGPVLQSSTVSPHGHDLQRLAWVHDTQTCQQKEFTRPERQSTEHSMHSPQSYHSPQKNLRVTDTDRSDCKVQFDDVFESNEHCPNTNVTSTARDITTTDKQKLYSSKSMFAGSAQGHIEKGHNSNIEKSIPGKDNNTGVTLNKVSAVLNKIVTASEWFS